MEFARIPGLVSRAGMGFDVKTNRERDVSLWRRRR